MDHNLPIQDPPERLEKFGKIGISLDGLSPAAVITHIIHGEISCGAIPLSNPGYAIKRCDKTLSIESESWCKELTTRGHALGESQSRAPGTFEFEPVPAVRRSEPAPARKSLRHTDTPTGGEQVVAVLVAGDLADAIKPAAE